MDRFWMKVKFLLAKSIDIAKVLILVRLKIFLRCSFKELSKIDFPWINLLLQLLETLKMQTSVIMMLTYVSVSIVLAEGIYAKCIKLDLTSQRTASTKKTSTRNAQSTTISISLNNIIDFKDQIFKLIPFMGKISLEKKVMIWKDQLLKIS